MHLHINPHDESPVYRQIQRQIAQAIADREIRPGERLEDDWTAVLLEYRRPQRKTLCRS